MKRLFRVLLWIVAIFAGANTIGYVFALLLDQKIAPTTHTAGIIWFILGAAVVIYEVKSTKKNESHSMRNDFLKRRGIKKRSRVRFGLSVLGILFILVIVLSAFLPSSDQRQQPSTLQPRSMSTTESGIYLEVNKIRVANSLPPFTNIEQLNNSARAKCKDMVDYNYYEHRNSRSEVDGVDYAIKSMREITDPHYTIYANENLVKGVQDTPKAFAESWMRSENHKAAILNPQYTDSGYAICTAKDGEVMIVQHLAGIR
jgi:uncharacterized protein YkwD